MVNNKLATKATLLNATIMLLSGAVNGSDISRKRRRTQIAHVAIKHAQITPPRILPSSVKNHLRIVLSPPSIMNFARSLDVFDQENILLLTKVGKRATCAVLSMYEDVRQCIHYTTCAVFGVE